MWKWGPIEELVLWRQAVELAKAVYQLTANFPASELYGLVSQMRRSAVSVASNIAEGAARHTDREFIQFLYIALGSLLNWTHSAFLPRNWISHEVPPHWKN